MSPDVYSVVNARIQSIVSYLQSALEHVEGQRKQIVEKKQVEQENSRERMETLWAMQSSLKDLGRFTVPSAIEKATTVQQLRQQQQQQQLQKQGHQSDKAEGNTIPRNTRRKSSSKRTPSVLPLKS